MADYNEISTLSQMATQATEGPTDAEVASKLDDAIHQIQRWLVNFLGVSFADNGALKAGSVVAETFTGGTGAIPTSALLGDIPGSKIQAGTIDYARLEPYTGLGTGAVGPNVIQPDAITTTKILDTNVTAAKLAAGCIDTANKLATDVVTAGAIAAGSVTDVKLASGIDGTKLASGTVPPTALAITPLTGTEIGLPVCFATGASNNKIAKIGGTVTVAYNAGTNTLEFTPSASGSEAVVGRFAVATSGTNVTASWTKRTGWAKLEGDATFTLATDTIVLGTTGTYLIYATLLGYSCEGLQIRIVLNGNSASAKYSDVTFVPVGGAQSVTVLAAVTATAATDYVQLDYFTTRAQASNGLGRALGGVSVPQFATMTITRVV